MKIFLDTNVFLDFALDRGYADEAEHILNLIESGQFSAYVADITLVNIAYVARKQKESNKRLLHFITKHFTVVGAENREFEQALAASNKDLEDNLQVVLAEKAMCQIIITNDQTFPREKIDVISSVEFVKHYCL